MNIHISISLIVALVVGVMAVRVLMCVFEKDFETPDEKGKKDEDDCC